MKVLLVSEYYPPYVMGGGEISMSILAEELAKKIEVHVLTSGFPGSERYEEKNNVRIHRLLTTGKNPKSLLDSVARRFNFRKSLLSRLEMLHAQEKFDLFHCFNITSIHAVLLRKKVGRPFILHVNSPLLFCPKGTLMFKDKGLCEKDCTRLTYLDCFINSQNLGKMRLAPWLKYNPLVILEVRRQFEEFQRLVKGFDHFLSISTFMDARLARAGIVARKREVCYNIVEAKKIPLDSKNKVLYLGELSEPKGPQILMEALKGTGLKARFYGKGVLENSLKQYIKKHDIDAEIVAPVAHENVGELYAQHDMVVIPSIVGEAFSRVALESLMSGRKVIASRVGGITDIIEDGKNGWLFSPGDVEDLRKKIMLAAKTKLPFKVPPKFNKEIIVKKVLDRYLVLTKTI